MTDTPSPRTLVIDTATAACSVALFDGDRLVADTRRICEELIRFWHGPSPKPPHSSYVFMLNVVDDGYGGLEHRNSTALICGRRDLPRQGEARTPEGYTTLLGLISHEYFHTWNVKRLRPSEFARYDYGQENYTELLWFFEGFFPVLAHPPSRPCPQHPAPRLPPARSTTVSKPPTRTPTCMR